MPLVALVLHVKLASSLHLRGHTWELTMIIDRTGHLLATKAKLTTLLRTALGDCGPNALVQVSYTERDEQGCNWTAALQGDQDLGSERREEFQRSLRALQAAYSLSRQ